jgi:hypothetical protein
MHLWCALCHGRKIGDTNRQNKKTTRHEVAIERDSHRAYRKEQLKMMPVVMMMTPLIDDDSSDDNHGGGGGGDAGDAGDAGGDEYDGGVR